MFKALFAAVPAACHSWLWKGGGLGGHTVAAVHIFLGHSSRVERQKLVFPALPQVTLCNLLITAITCLLR